MRKTRLRYVALAAAILVATLLLPVLNAEPGVRTPSISGIVLSQETEIQRRKVDIHPVASDTGIKTGFMFLYGYYVSPPYAIEVRGCSTFVNGVRVYPELELPDVKPDSASLAAFLATEYWLVGHHVDSICLAYGLQYWEDIARGASPAQAGWRAESLLLADPYVDTVLRPVEGILRVLARSVMLDGKPRKLIAREVVFTDLSPERRVVAEVDKDLRAQVAATLARSFHHTLGRNRCVIMAQGYRASKGREHAWELARAMLRTGLTDRELWYELAEFRGYGDAMSLIANRYASAGRWQGLLNRLEDEDENR